MSGIVCTVCVMDASNPSIAFDAAGQCNCCKDAIARRRHEWWPDAEGERRFDALADRLRTQGHGRPYDAMIGLSGGIDSAYLAHALRTRYDLRLLAVHVDGGWNSEAAVHNIELIVRQLNLDLHTHVIEWQEMRDLQLAFLRAGVLNQDIPQDHAFFATLYRTAARFGIRSFLSGVNYSSESVVPPSWGYPAMDGTHVRGVHRAKGQAQLATYPVMGYAEFLWKTRLRKLLTVHRPLNFMAYDKEAAKAELRAVYNWRDYGGKHSESRFTKFYQDIYLPRKFGFDKRRLHLSSLIVSGQISRTDALAELTSPIADPQQMRRDARFVAKKLGIAPAELEALIDAPAVPHHVYPNQAALYARLTRARSVMRGLWPRRGTA